MKTKRTTAAGGADMLEVQGTHILRPTGGRDRHSKIYTAKGPRDRRVRLSAHTAIQFYDVQDRLGYDRPSKAVDWLITKAKSSIDQLSEPQPSSMGEDLKSNSTGYCFQIHGLSNDENNRSNAVLPLDLDSMKAFFPTSSAETFINFQTYPSNVISQTVDSSKDLDLSLQTFKNVGMVLDEHSSESEGKFFSDSSPAGYEAFCGRTVDWNSDRSAEHGGGFVFPTPSMSKPPSLGQGLPAFPPRETLQPTAWFDIPTPDYGTRTEIRPDDEQGTALERLPLSSSPISHQLQRKL